MNKIEAVCLACYLDAEGYFCLSRRKDGGRYKVRVGAETCDYDKLFSIYSLTGCGNLRLASKRRGRKWSDKWIWNADSRQAESVLRAVIPFLSLKKTQAKTLLAYLTEFNRRPGVKGYSSEQKRRQILYYNAMKVLNTRGVS